MAQNIKLDYVMPCIVSADDAAFSPHQMSGLNFHVSELLSQHPPPAPGVHACLPMLLHPL